MVATKTNAKAKANADSFPSTKSFIKMGFGLGIGSMLATIIFMIIAAALFIPGFIIVKKQHANPKEEREKGLLITGYVLMGLGAVIGVGFGASTLLSLIGEDL